jgi:putative FmdB family regulatory protein
MPIYEFLCGDCRRVTNHFTRKVDTELKVACEHCGSGKTARMMSKFGRTYSRADIIDKYGDPSDGRGGPDDYRDPRQIGPGSRSGSKSTDGPAGGRPRDDRRRPGRRVPGAGEGPVVIHDSRFTIHDSARLR